MLTRSHRKFHNKYLQIISEAWKQKCFAAFNIQMGNLSVFKHTTIDKKGIKAQKNILSNPVGLDTNYIKCSYLWRSSSLYWFDTEWIKKPLPTFHGHASIWRFNWTVWPVGGVEVKVMPLLWHDNLRSLKRMTDRFTSSYLDRHIVPAQNRKKKKRKEKLRTPSKNISRIILGMAKTWLPLNTLEPEMFLL